MKLSGVGLEPHECNDEFLIKRLGLSKAVLILVGVIVLAGSIFFFDQLLVMIPAFGIFGISVFFIFREARAIQKELDKRAMQTGNKTYTEEIRKTSRLFLGIVVVGIAIFVVVLTSALSGKSGGGSSGSTTCPNCGTSYRSDTSAADFIRGNGYCSSCRGR